MNNFLAKSEQSSFSLESAKLGNDKVAAPYLDLPKG